MGKHVGLKTVRIPVAVVAALGAVSATGIGMSVGGDVIQEGFVETTSTSSVSTSNLPSPYSELDGLDGWMQAVKPVISTVSVTSTPEPAWETIVPKPVRQTVTEPVRRTVTVTPTRTSTVARHATRTPLKPPKPKPKVVKPKVKPAPASSASSSATGSRRGVLKVAKSLFGIPYVWGGNTPASGMDCSGYVKYVYGKNGKQLPRVAHDQYRAAKKVKTPVPGDLVFFHDSHNYVYHIGIYSRPGYAYQAKKPGTKIGEFKIWSKNVTYGTFF